MNNALFLDRDGVINVNHGYVYLANDFDFIDGIFELVKRANAANMKVIVVTNQSGIARGMYTEDDFEDLSRWMIDRFSEQGARIDAVFHCPHHPEAKLERFRSVCDCRKPKAGMLLHAASELNIALASSIMVGDKSIDMQAAAAAGLATAYWYTPEANNKKSRGAINAKAAELETRSTAIVSIDSLASVLKTQ
jgi:D-glycero-D-manno-heptose 1,7-bisphosphate phosphatase